MTTEQAVEHIALQNRVAALEARQRKGNGAQHLRWSIGTLLFALLACYGMNI